LEHSSGQVRIRPYLATASSSSGNTVLVGYGKDRSFRTDAARIPQRDIAMKRLRRLLDINGHIDSMFVPGLLSLGMPDGL
jgi:hypothetical protein